MQNNKIHTHDNNFSIIGRNENPTQVLAEKDLNTACSDLFRQGKRKKKGKMVKSERYCA